MALGGLLHRPSIMKFQLRYMLLAVTNMNQIIDRKFPKYKTKKFSLNCKEQLNDLCFAGAWHGTTLVGW